MTLRRIRYLWADRVPLGCLTLMPGEEGIGKTLIASDVIAQITRGRLPGELYGTPRDVVILAVEDNIDEVVVPRLRAAGADCSRAHIARARCWLGKSADVIAPRDLDLIAQEVTWTDAPLVFIDSLVTTLPDDLKTISYKDTAKVLKAFSGWAGGLGISVLAPWHLNKAAGSDTAVRIMDSRAFRTTVRSMLLVVADPDDPGGATQGIIALDKSKATSRHSPQLRYRVDAFAYTVREVNPKTGCEEDKPTRAVSSVG